ncbi:thiol reductant ABC exporter subunit CydC [Brevibacterium sp. BRM-1]|uniref:thiol reductant ABC exporter subunit CydC n=1 Tax=Brevibacterium sp. BRM-1 TaxID=2999062 RepID=UPI00227E087E|nr:thiol reductant ABC exporter subunit CydC [Brevibacterium sp. BRM-1]WAL41059.1 thiol reductant ABC exporter subunit CydC [Brevibacterium sp. BRM-1]
MSRRQGPAGPALADPAGRRALLALTATALVRAVGLVLIAEAVARGIVALPHGEPIGTALACGIVGALLRGAAAWAQRSIGARAAVAVKTALRAALVDRAIAGSGRDLPLSDGALTVAATRSLDDLDDYYTAVLPALTSAAAIPLVLGVRIAFADLTSAVILLITLPLVPLFMVLIGKYTSGRVAEAVHSLDQLSTNLVELARGLPVLIGLGRVRAQTRALAAMSESYRRTTLQTLRVAFLSALALELIATISVALVAVFIGVRLVAGTMDLEAGLLALVLAPEVFLPLRQLGAAFHSSENGMAARERAQEIIASEPAAPAGEHPAPGAAEPLVLESLSVSYAGRAEPALAPCSARIGAGLTVVAGPSGAGKSTLLGVLAGLVRTDAETTVSGSATGVPAALALAAQAPRTFATTLRAELSAYAGRPLAAEEAAGLLTRASLALEPEFPCAALSPGELRRLALARALAGVEAGAGLLLADEPTAHLDAAAAARVRAELAAVARTVPVIAATHDPALLAAAQARIDVGAPGSRPHASPARANTAGAASAPSAVAPAGSAPAASIAPSPAGVPTAPAAADPVGSDRPAAHPAGADGPESAAGNRPPLRTLLGRLARAVDIRAPKFWLAVLMGVCSAAAASALIAVSGWLIVRAAAHPPIMYLLVAIVGVRFFGISRSVFAYAKQLCLHDAVLGALTRLRAAVWTAFARTGTANRTLLRGELALRRLISDVDDIRDLAPRVVLGPIVAVILAAAAIGVEWSVHPAAGLLTALGCAGALLAAPALALAADAHASTARLSARGRVLDGLARLLWAREDLIAAGRAPAAAAQVARDDVRTAGWEARALRATGAGEALVTVCGVLTGVLMLPVLAGAVAAGEVSGEMLAVAVLLPLSLIDPFADALTSLQQWPALASVLARTPELDREPFAAGARALEAEAGDGGAARGAADGGGAVGGGSLAHGAARLREGQPRELVLRDVAARWPGTDRDVFTGLSAAAQRGSWTVVTGPSGAGKTTLVSIVLRFLDPRAGSYALDGGDALALSPEDLAGHIAWCPQEAHVFDSSLRANLLLARPRDLAPDDAELTAVLERVGLGGLAADMGLDARIGAGGGRLSGGQRQRLAVARTLLAGASAIVLDEPTAHLDEALAAALMADLRAGLADTAVILVTHDESLALAGDRRVAVGARPAAVPVAQPR